MVITQTDEDWGTVPSTSTKSKTGFFGLDEISGIALLIFIILLGLEVMFLFIKYFVLPRMSAHQSKDRERLLSKNQEMIGKEVV
jgi:hypothetical protein